MATDIKQLHIYKHIHTHISTANGNNKRFDCVNTVDYSNSMHAYPWPTSWAIKKEVPNPMSWLILQFLVELQAPATQAIPVNSKDKLS